MLKNQGPKILTIGKDITLVGIGFTTHLCIQAEQNIKNEKAYSAEVIDVRVLNPFKINKIRKSFTKTKRILVVDGGWKTCGFSSEILARLFESNDLNLTNCRASRLTLADTPAPSSKDLEKHYYPNVENVVQKSLKMLLKYL